MWLGVIVACVGCYALKYAGMSVPQRVLDSPAVRQLSLLLPVGLLAALAAAQTLADGERLMFDARIVGVLVAIIAIRLKCPFIVVVALAAASAAVARLLGMP
ncbi:AzlD domain-containing protein [Cumulibacter soli]|uniref:AzlD domain-containing protein n=1 Tax=Cumulibacter soli TaxID=2546344 RepID=UPI00106875D8|nr:AzlD domain-containing protein [Cumulibacter soli]